MTQHTDGMPDKVFLRMQDHEEAGTGVYEGTKDNGFEYLFSTAERKAAPDLLEALKKCVKHLERDFPSDAVDESVYLNAIAAIKNAESKQ